MKALLTELRRIADALERLANPEPHADVDTVARWRREQAREQAARVTGR